MQTSYIITKNTTISPQKTATTQNNDILLSVFWLGFGLFFLIRSIVKKKNKKKIWGTFLIVLGIVALLYAMGFGLAFLIASAYANPNISPIGLAITGAILGIGAIIALIFGDKLLRKGKQEEREALK